MQLSRGYFTRLVLDEETSFNEIPTAKTGKIMPFNKLELASEQTMINPATITGTRNAVEPARGHVTAGGSVTIPVDSTAIGYWLKGIFNSPTTTKDGDTSKYKHVFSITNNQPSLCITKEFPDIGQYFTYTGVKIGSFSCTFGDDGELTADMDLLGCDEIISSEQYDRAATEAKLSRLNNFACELKVNGSKVANVSTLDLKLDMGLDDSIYTLGHKGRGAIPEGLVQVSGTIHSLFTDTELLQKGIDATPIDLELALTNSSDSLVIKMDEAQISRTSPAISGPAGVSVDIDFVAYYKNSVDKSSIVIELTNSVEEY